MTTPTTPEPTPDAGPESAATPRRRFRLFRASAQTLQDRDDARHTDPGDLQRARAARAADLIGATHHPAPDDDTSTSPTSDADSDAGSADEQQTETGAGAERDAHPAEHAHADTCCAGEDPAAQHEANNAAEPATAEPAADTRRSGESGDALGRMQAALDELPDPAQLDRLDRLDRLAELAGLDQPSPPAAAADLDDRRGNGLHHAGPAGDFGDDDGTGR